MSLGRFLSSLVPALPSEDELEASVVSGRDSEMAEEDWERKALFCDEYVVRAAAQASAARGITIAVRRLDPNDARALWENAERLWKARPESLK